MRGADEVICRVSQKAEWMQKIMNLLGTVLEDCGSLIDRDYIENCQQIVDIIRLGSEDH